MTVMMPFTINWAKLTSMPMRMGLGIPASTAPTTVRSETSTAPIMMTRMALGMARITIKGAIVPITGISIPIPIFVSATED